MRSRLAFRSGLVALALAGIAVGLLVRDPDRWLAHLSGTGTIPGIAIYRGPTYLKLGTGQFPNLGLAARYIESHLSREVVQSSWAGH